MPILDLNENIYYPYFNSDEVLIHIFLIEMICLNPHLSPGLHSNLSLVADSISAILSIFTPNRNLLSADLE